MSIQPSGDYRLIPWAYPPIPGGKSAGGSGLPLDFSNILVVKTEVAVAKLKSTSSSEVSNVVFHVNVRDIGVNNISNVSAVQLRARITELEYYSSGVPVTGNDAASYAVAVSELDMQSIQDGVVQTVTFTAYRDNPIPGTTDWGTYGNPLVAKLTAVALDVSGAVLQTYELPDSVTYTYPES